MPATERALTRSLGVSFLLVSCAGLGLVLYSTRDSVGLWIDSASYIGAARSLANGDGLKLPFDGDQRLSVLAPLFSVALAGGAMIGVDPLVASRWLNAGLFAVTIWLSASTLFRYGGSRSVALAGALLVALSADLLHVHQYALSEPLFLLLLLLSWASLAEFFSTPRRIFIAVAATAAALALLTRYAGVALAAAGAVSLIIIGRRGVRDRLADVALWSMLSLGPPLVWSVVAPSATNAQQTRTLAWHPIPLQRLVLALETMATWVLPVDDLRPWWVVVAALVASALFFYARRSILPALHPRILMAGRASALPLVLATFVVSYLLMLVAVISVVDFQTAMNARILAPAHFALILLAMCGVHTLTREAPRARRVAWLGVAWLVVLSAVRLPESMQRQAPMGVSVDYGSRAWRESELMNAVRALPGDSRIHTNVHDAVYLLTGRHAYRMPQKRNARAGRPNAAYDSEMESLRAAAATSETVFVYSSRIARTNMPSDSELRSFFGVRPLVTVNDGTIYVTGAPTSYSR